MRRPLVSALLYSSFAFAFAAVANASPPSNVASAQTHRVSTGVTPPQLLNSLQLTFPDPQSAHALATGNRVSVSFLVDEKGQIQNIRVVQGIDAIWNARIVDAVRKLHYRPATMDNEPVPMAVNLNINLAH